jgi:hypothetical protein
MPFAEQDKSGAIVVENFATASILRGSHGHNAEIGRLGDHRALVMGVYNR